jgi:CubicO group peptidase (beta-lactamase class C family)
MKKKKKSSFEKHEFFYFWPGFFFWFFGLQHHNRFIFDFPVLLALWCLSTMASSILNESKRAAIQEILTSSHHIPNGEVAIFAVLNRHSKTADFVLHGPISATNTLRLGSITKIFLSYVTLKAQLPLEKTVAEFLPELSDELIYQGSHKITFKDCLSHTTGIVNYSKVEGAQSHQGTYTPAVTVDLGWKNRPLLFEPGTQWHYSNTNSEIIAMAVEKLTGKPIKQLVDEAFHEIAPTLTFDSGASHSYPIEAPGYKNFTMPWSFPSASGRLLATPLDALRAIDSISSEKVWHTMQTWATAPKREPDPGYDPAGGKKYGYYLQEFDFEVPIFGHDGHIHVTSFIGSTDDHVFLVHTSADIDTHLWMPLCSSLISAAIK